MTGSEYSEDSLVEQPAIALFAELDYESAVYSDSYFSLSATIGIAG